MRRSTVDRSDIVSNVELFMCQTHCIMQYNLFCVPQLPSFRQSMRTNDVRMWVWQKHHAGVIEDDMCVSERPNIRV